MKGARLIPSVCSPVSPPGERDIFEAFQADSGASGWVALHSLDLIRHVAKAQGEADFVVIIPKRGIVVLEVKSHSFVKYDERGWWLGNTAEPDPRGPFKQASQAMHSVRKYLNDVGFLTDGIPFVSAVVFPRVSFSTKSPEWHPWQVLDVQALRARSISANLLRIIEKARELYAAQHLRWATSASLPTEEDCETLTRLLRPRFEFLASPIDARKDLEKSLLRCTEQQFRFLDNVADNERLIVSGLAGTGKTTLAVESLRREVASNCKSRIALFCFNRLLGEKLRADCAAVSASIRSGSFHRWLLEFTNVRLSLRASSDPDFWSRRLPERALDLLTSADGTSGVLDLLILDEAQDLFQDAYLDIFDLLLKGGLAQGRWLFFGDFERQDLFAKGSVSVKEFRAKRATRGSGVFRLDVNCRNTLEIANAITLMAKLSPGYSATLRGDSHNDPELSVYNTREMQVELATKVLHQLLESGFKPEDITLLSPYADKSLARRLGDLPQWRGRLGAYPAGRTKINYSTIHAFKGLESPAVILTDIDDVGATGRLDLFYVGISRALHRLHIFVNQSVRESLGKQLS
jgi:hypothetical protein